MSEHSELLEYVTREASLPRFCTITEAVWINVTVPHPESSAPTSKRVILAYFTFPGATEDGTWYSHLRDIAYVDEADYDRYQQLKAQWLEENTDGG